MRGVVYSIKRNKNLENKISKKPAPILAKEWRQKLDDAKTTYMHTI